MFWRLFFILTLTLSYVSSEYSSSCLTTDQGIGLCMPVKSCRTIYDTFARISRSGGAILEDDKAKLVTSYCGTFKTVPHVCCPKEEVQLNVDGLNILKSDKCGVYIADRIANGQNSYLFQYPWMALLKYKDEVNPFKCAGTLISNQYVLTAAHCLKNIEHKIKEVRLGEYQIDNQIDCTNVTRKNQCAPPVEDVGIEEIIIHGDYQTIYNDIALIRLNRTVEFKRHIKPICLPIFENLRINEHENYLVLGWGKTENGTSSDILRAAFIPRVKNLECENQLRMFNLRYPLNEGHMCAGGKNLVDSCRGDSGGPLGYQDFYEGRLRFVQYGIVSIGLRNCGAVNVPGIYTNISHYMQWITDNLKKSLSESANFTQEDNSANN